MPHHRGYPVRHLSNMCDDLVQGEPEFIHHVDMSSEQRHRLSNAKKGIDEDSDAVPFAEFMIGKRESLGMTQDEAAKRIGIPVWRLREFENARSFPTMNETFSIRTAYNVGKERMHIKRFSK